MMHHTALPILDVSHVGEARRIAVGLASALEFDESESGRVALVVTEAVTNVVKHARQGLVLLRSMREVPGKGGIEVLALDKGPGMADVSRCMVDGYSTAGSPGTGLGALQRVASFLEIYSSPGLGTALLAQVLPSGVRQRVERVVAGAVRVAAPRETECGDDWHLEQVGSRAVLLVVDGLGHGPQAAVAAAEAVRSFESSWRDGTEAVLERVHGALRATRGAAGSIADLDLDAREVRFAGMGNVTGFVAWPGGSRGMLGQNGTLGGHAQARRFRETPYPWMPGASLIMYTDGLTSHVNVNGYPGLLGHHPTLVAGVLYRDYNRGRDDATVVVVREAAG